MNKDKLDDIALRTYLTSVGVTHAINDGNVSKLYDYLCTYSACFSRIGNGFSFSEGTDNLSKAVRKIFRILRDIIRRNKSSGVLLILSYERHSLKKNIHVLVDGLINIPDHLWDSSFQYVMESN